MTAGTWPVYVSPGVQSPFPNWAMYQRMAGAVVPALTRGFWGRRGLPMGLGGLIFSTGGRRTGWMPLWRVWLDGNGHRITLLLLSIWGIAIKIKEVISKALRRDHAGVGFDIVLAW